jgi:hypothetical protein
MLLYQMVQREFFLRKKWGESDGIFGWVILIRMPVGTMHVLSDDGLFLYEGLAVSWRFYTVSKSTLTFPRILG